MYHRDMVCFRYIIVNTVHKGDNNNNNNNNNNNSSTIISHYSSLCTTLHLEGDSEHSVCVVHLTTLLVDTIV